MSKCHCQEEAADITQKSVLLTLLLINGLMFCAELVASIIADSTGLLADSLDMLADAIVYGIALYAVGRAASAKTTAARWSGYFQIALACGVGIDILRRLAFGSEPQSWFMLGVGLVALIANVACLAMLAKHRQGRGPHARQLDLLEERRDRQPRRHGGRSDHPQYRHQVA